MAPSPVDELALLDLERSNKGASKQRRDQINSEIGVMRDLLPLPESSRQRLSQLQVMSLSCVFIRKCNILQKMIQSQSCPSEAPCEFSQSLTGFLLVTTRDGKLVYISENVTEYLGHSMVDMKTQGDSLFDIVDKRDHGTVQAQLMHGGGDTDKKQPISFFCRMNMSRTLKRQAGFGDVKVMHVRGHFVSVPGQDSGSEQQVFISVCSPLITPDVKETLIQNNTMVFKSIHHLDMNFLEISQNGEYHLGIESDQVKGKSWYSCLHPEDIHEAREKHIQLVKSRHEMGSMMTVRMITGNNEVIWVNIVMHVRQALLSNSDEPVIFCINQVISEHEAYQFKIQGQLFALCATRASDFFFGSTFCAPVSQQALETGMISQQQQGSPNFVPSSFFAGQTVFDASTPSPQGFNRSAMFSSQPNLCMRNNVPGQVMGRQGQGHTNTLKALKRKLQENFSSTCKPIKVPRMTQERSSGNGFMVSGGTPLPSSFEGNSYRNIHNPGVAPQHAVTTGPVQMMYCLNNNVLPTKQKSLVSDPLPAFVEQTRLMQKTPSLEQVVPELPIIPACYPTPEPSPVSSPQPQMKQEVIPSSVDPILVAKHLCAIRQKHAVGTQQSTKVSNAEPQKKLLPSLDVSFVDSFFDEIGTLDGQPLSIRGLLQRVKQEPVDVTDYNCLQTKEKQLPAFEQFDIDELFESNGANLNNTCNNFVGMKMEMEDQRIPLCESQPSPTPSSPRSTVEDKLSYDDIMSSVVLTPESDFDTDQCEDLDPDSWMLETCNIDMSTKGLDLFAEAKLQTDFCLKKAGPCSDETELYQLKQLISSWTPSGVSESSEESQ